MEARRAISQLQGVPHGARETEMQAIAHQQSGHKDTSALRRAIAAYEFLERLKAANSAAYRHLNNAPLSIVEAVARWFSFDPDGALAAAEDWAGGVGNVRTINRAAKDARPSGYAGKTGIALERAYAGAAKPYVTSAVRDLTESEVKLIANDVRNDPMGQTLDYVFETTRDPAERVAVMVIGPYNNPKLYLSRGGDWVARAFGLAWLFDRIVLALPEARALADYTKRITAVKRESEERFGSAGSHMPMVDVVHVNVPKLTPEEDEMLARAFGPP